MPSTVDNLILDLLEWLRPGPLPYVDVLDAWRTSCPRLPVWEEANERGYLEHRFTAGQGHVVALSTLGLDVVRLHRTISRSNDR
jgi:hypothetical protein